MTSVLQKTSKAAALHRVAEVLEAMGIALEIKGEAAAAVPALLVRRDQAAVLAAAAKESWHVYYD